MLYFTFWTRNFPFVLFKSFIFLGFWRSMMEDYGITKIENLMKGTISSLVDAIIEF